MESTESIGILLVTWLGGRVLVGSYDRARKKRREVKKACFGSLPKIPLFFFTDLYL